MISNAQMTSYSPNSTRVPLLVSLAASIMRKEKVVQHGPYVMNTQTEVMEAMRDYQQGKMGFLPN